MTSPNTETIAAWTALITASKRVLENVELALKAANLPSLSWYDALLEIERMGKEGVRPFELKERLLLPQYGTSRLLDRIAKAGLIEKRSCVDDGRGLVVCITAKGRRVRRQMWPIYADALQRCLEQQINKKDLEMLTLLCQQISYAAKGC